MSEMMVVGEKIKYDSKFLFVGGAPKAGTTSFHNWLSNHPDVASSKVKETRFFLDRENPLPRAIKSPNKIEEYFTFFHSKDIDAKKILLDTSPDYLYSVGPLRIPEYFKNSKCIFILRDPVARFKSHYKYAMQRELIGSDISLLDFYEMQNAEFLSDSMPHLNALLIGKYENFLKEYKNQFGDNLKILQFEELIGEPENVMPEVCEFLGISSEFYDEYNFDIHNKTDISGNSSVFLKVYQSTRRWIAFRVLEHDVLMSLLKTVNAPLKRYLNRQAAGKSGDSLINRDKGQKSEDDMVANEKLEAYYS